MNSVQHSMRRGMWLCCSLLFGSALHAQNVGINTNGAAPHASALLDVDAAALPANGKRAMLIPRMTTVERNTIPTPAVSLLVYDITTTSFWYFNGMAWAEWADDLNTWKVNGNTGLTAGTHFIGTTDAQPMQLRANGVMAGRIALDITSFGVRASLANLTTAVDQTTFGYEALQGSGAATQEENTAIGHNALKPPAGTYDCTAIGSETMLNDLSIPAFSSNTAIGHRAFRDVYGSSSTAVGYRALEASDNDYATAAGSQAMLATPNNYDNTAMGYQAGMAGANGVGRGAAMGLAGFGFGAGACATSDEYANHAFGYNALTNVTTGNGNCAVGFAALSTGTVNDNCTAIGAQSLIGATGSQNTALGFSALDGVGSGSFNTGLGAFAGPTVGTLNYTSAIGYNAVPSATGRIVFGTTLSTNLTGGFGAWQNPSDARFKRDVREDVPGIELIGALRPVTYRLDAPAIERFLGAEARLERSGDAAALAEHRAGWERVAQERHTGLLAQEAAATLHQLDVCTDIVHVPSTEQDHYTIGYAAWVVPLVRSVQQQQERIAALRTANQELMVRLEQLEKDASATYSTTSPRTP